MTLLFIVLPDDNRIMVRPPNKKNEKQQHDVRDSMGAEPRRRDQASRQPAW
ncbi:hypothetical protein [Dickeya sp. NCPPB 3274]|uniref:hypothetical protein n=1 Tax=Dickeya sp. NCPPB 3274 TaxID=568766 RepID=UPI00187C53A0|nr:hypothetical protein [Dickeya sp. NCPPB 3274]